MHDQYEVQYGYQSQSLLNLNESSTTLGDIQIAIARSMIENKYTTMSLWASIKLPTGDKNKLSSNGATDFSAWLAMNQRLGQNWLLNLNAGAVILGNNTYQDIPLSDSALYGHAMLGWLMTDDINLKVQLHQPLHMMVATSISREKKRAIRSGRYGSPIFKRGPQAGSPIFRRTVSNPPHYLMALWYSAVKELLKKSWFLTSTAVRWMEQN